MVRCLVVPCMVLWVMPRELATSQDDFTIHTNQMYVPTTTACALLKSTRSHSQLYSCTHSIHSSPKS